MPAGDVHAGSHTSALVYSCYKAVAVVAHQHARFETFNDSRKSSCNERSSSGRVLTAARHSYSGTVNLVTAHLTTVRSCTPHIHDAHAVGCTAQRRTTGPSSAT
jgi:hypothetical protein